MKSMIKASDIRNREQRQASAFAGVISSRRRLWRARQTATHSEWRSQKVAPARYLGVVCLLVVISLSAGCLTVRDVERTRHYALRPDIAITEVETLELTLGIRPLFAARPYGLPMARLDGARQLSYRDRDQWAEPPANTVTRALSDAVAAIGRFRDVGNAADMARPDLLLTGELRMFHENSVVTPPSAEIEVRLELRPAREQGALWSETLRETAPMESDSPEAFAAAMNQALSRLIVRAAKSMAAVTPPDYLFPHKTNER